jgi:hypothetical protein
MDSHHEQGGTNLEAFPPPVSEAEAEAPAEAVAASKAEKPSAGPRGGCSVRYVLVALLGTVSGGAAAYFLKPSTVPETVFLNFDAESTPKGMLGSGWAPVFEHFKDGVTFSWCAALRCTLNVQSNAKHERLIRVRILPFHFQGAPAQTVTLYLNETKVGVRPVPDALTTLSFPTSRGYWIAGTNSLTFEFAYAKDPKSVIPGNGDARMLSAAFDWIDITSR